MCLLMLVGDGSWPDQGQLPGQPRRVAASLCGVSYDDDVMTVQAIITQNDAAGCLLKSLFELLLTEGMTLGSFSN